jgi:LPS-assembly lipoprotein
MRRALLAAAGLSLVALNLSACGFTPLYATRGLPASLSSIEIVAPEGRTGYLLRESLDDALGRNPGAVPAYRLTYSVDEKRDPRGLGPDNAASRYEVSLKVTYHLTDLATSKEVKTGETEVFVTYGAADAPYAGIAAQNAGQQSAATEVAQRIRTDIAEYLAGQATG